MDGLGERKLRERLTQYKAVRDAVARLSPEYDGQPQHKNPEIYAFNRAVRRFEDELRAGPATPAATASDAEHLGLLAFAGYDRVERAGPVEMAIQKLTNLRLLMWLYLMEMKARTPLYYFWLFAEPALQVLMIVGMYLLAGRVLVLDMPALPFAVLGVSSMLMFRNVMNRMLGGMGRDSNLLLLPRFAVMDVYIARALHSGLIYMLIGALYLYILHALGVGEAPENLLGVLGWWAMIWGLGLGFGLTLRGLAQSFPWVRKLNVVIFRAIFLTSGVFYVTEQLPEEFKAIVLWNPLLNMLQGLRDAYFWEYSTKEISFSYASWALLLLLFTGLMNLRRDKIGD